MDMCVYFDLQIQILNSMKSIMTNVKLGTQV